MNDAELGQQVWAIAREVLKGVPGGAFIPR